MSVVPKVVLVVFLWLLIFWAAWHGLERRVNEVHPVAPTGTLNFGEAQEYLLSGQWDKFIQWAQATPSQVWHDREWQNWLWQYQKMLFQAGYTGEADFLRALLQESEP